MASFLLELNKSTSFSEMELVCTTLTTQPNAENLLSQVIFERINYLDDSHRIDLEVLCNRIRVLNPLSCPVRLCPNLNATLAWIARLRESLEEPSPYIWQTSTALESIFTCLNERDRLAFMLTTKERMAFTKDVISRVEVETGAKSIKRKLVESRRAVTFDAAVNFATKNKLTCINLRGFRFIRGEEIRLLLSNLVWPIREIVLDSTSIGEIQSIINHSPGLHSFQSCPYNPFLADVAVLSLLNSCTRLKKLALPSCLGLTSLLIADACANLESIDLSGNRQLFTDGRFLQQLSLRTTKLTQLKLYGIGLTNGEELIHLVKKCTNLQSLNIGRSCLHTEHMLELLDNTPSLKEFDFSGSSMTVSVIQRLASRFPALTALNLATCADIHGETLGAIATGFSSLRTLDISYCPNLFDMDFSSLVDGFPDLQDFSIRGCAAIKYTSLMAFIRNHTALRSIDLYMTNVKDQTLELIAVSCTQLTSICTTETFVLTAGICAVLDGCTKLKQLEIQYIDDVGAAMIAARGKQLHSLKIQDASELQLSSIKHLLDLGSRLQTFAAFNCKIHQDLLETLPVSYPYIELELGIG